MTANDTGSYIGKFQLVPSWKLPEKNPSDVYVENLTSNGLKLHWVGGTPPFKLYTGNSSGRLNVLLEQENNYIVLNGYNSGQTVYFAVASRGRRTYGDVVEVIFP